METPPQVGFRSKNINPNQHHNQPKEIVNKNYLRHTRGDEIEVVRAKIKNPNYKAPADVNISQPKYIPQVRPYKGLSGTSAKLENLIAGQNKNPYTLTKLWNLGYLDEVNPNVFYGREYTLHLMREAGVDEVEVKKADAQTQTIEYLTSTNQATDIEQSTEEDNYTSTQDIVFYDVGENMREVMTQTAVGSRGGQRGRPALGTQQLVQRQD